MRGLRLRDLIVGFGFDRVDEVGELDGVLDEEHREVVAHQVVVALLGVELGGEASDVADGVGRSAEAGHRGEPDEHRRPFTGGGEEFRCGVGRQPVVISFEVAVGAGPAGVHHSLRDALMVEVGDLLAGVKIVEQGRPPLSYAQRIVGVIDAHPLLGGEVTGLPVHPIVVELLLFVVHARLLTGRSLRHRVPSRHGHKRWRDGSVRARRRTGHEGGQSTTTSVTPLPRSWPDAPGATASRVRAQLPKLGAAIAGWLGAGGTGTPLSRAMAKSAPWLITAALLA